MQFSNVILALFLSTAVMAKGHGGDSNNSTKAVSDKSLCKEMSHLEKFISEASNSTKVAAKTKNNATKIAEVAAKASAASVKLDAMTSNATLVSTCAVVNAAADTKSACKTMAKLQKEVDLAANATKLAAKTKNNATKAAEYTAKAAKAQTKLTAMTSNTTLVDACSALTGDKTTTAKAAASSGSSSAGVMINAKAGSVFSAIILVAVGTFML